MPNSVAKRYRRWYEYERDAHAKVVHSLESVPADRRSSIEYGRALAILAHMIMARRVWLGRLGVVPIPNGSLFPESVGLGQLVDQSREVEADWAGWLATIDDEALERSFEYQSLDGGRFRNQVEDILAQLYGHSWYHRGQIAMLVRAAGGAPAATDLIYWCRESTGASETPP